MRILLVEDNPGDVALIEELLAEGEPADFEVTAADRIAEALRKLGIADFDIVLLDLSLPDSGGVDTVNRMRAGAAALPIVVMTGLNDRNVAVSAIQAGAQDFIVKGQVSGETLSRTLKYAVERNQSAAQLRRSEQFLRATLDALPAGIAILDENGVVLEVNAAWQLQGPAHGANDRAIREGDNCLECLGDSPAASTLRLGIAAVLRGDLPRFEHEFLCADAREAQWCRCTATPFRGDGPRRVVLAFEDITARMRSELDLRKSQERLTRAVNAGRIALWDWDVQTGICDFSEEWARMLGCPHATLHGTIDDWLDRLHPEDKERFLATRELGDADRPPQISLELRLRHDDGAYRWCLSLISVTRGPFGARSVSGASVDVTERKRLEESLQQAQKMESVGRLAGGIAHDFNNLLSVIKGCVEMALEGPPNPESLRADLLDMHAATERASELTRQLLAFSRRQVLQPRIIDINQVILESERMLRRVLREDIRLELRQVDAPGTVLADPGQFAQVLMNLVVNARDAMPDGGLLTIETRPLRIDAANADQFPDLGPGDYAVVVVSDTGQGMDKETQNRIFEPFFTTKEKGKGTGLGHSTVYGIVKQSGGAVLLDSQPGAGASFRVCLPVAHDAPVPAPAPKPADKPPGSGETVLIVEDEPALRGITRRMLARLGYTTLTADCGAQALQVLDDHPGPVDLVLTDVVMPDMNGVRLVEKILAHFPGTKILYMSGYTDDAIAHHGVLGPGINFICKPFGPAELAERIRAVLDADSPARPNP